MDEKQDEDKVNQIDSSLKVEIKFKKPQAKQPSGKQPAARGGRAHGHDHGTELDVCLVPYRISQVIPGAKWFAGFDRIQDQFPADKVFPSDFQNP